MMMSLSEKTATSPASNSSAPAPVPTPKLRSCVVCRTRKVRCDKLSPCSNCRRANIACVLPSTDRPPRWARRLERNNNNAASEAPVQVMERLRNLESLVKELRGQLEQTSRGTAASSVVNSPGNSSHDRDTDNPRETSPSTDVSNLHQPLGRLVLQDANRSRYVSSAFWSRVNDEVSYFTLVDNAPFLTQ
jgi:Fungal Zn(2)-Cys(6) binuclear cluster domain